MRGLHIVGVLAGLGTLLVPSLAQGETPIHEAGRCAIRGHCGKQSFFGGELPCADNGRAKKPDAATREKLVGLCGTRWEETAVCCVEEQVSSKRAMGWA